MKKTILKKLAVKKETVRTLTPAELSDVVGGTNSLQTDTQPPGTDDCSG
jgi:hypothetical protein